MRTKASWILGSLAALGWFGQVAQAGGNWSVGVSVGGPGYYHRPCYGPGFGYGYGFYSYPVYRPYPVVVAPAPVYVAPAPVVVQQAPVVQPSYSAPPPAYEAPTPRPLPTSVTQVSATRQIDADRYLQQLASPDESVRVDSVMQLGRMRSERSIDPLAATLSGDRSPAVRDAAAKALGLIGSTKALPALQQASQVDSSNDVRRSAQYAIDVIQTR